MINCTKHMQRSHRGYRDKKSAYAGFKKFEPKLYKRPYRNRTNANSMSIDPKKTNNYLAQIFIVATILIAIVVILRFI